MTFNVINLSAEAYQSFVDGDGNLIEQLIGRFADKKREALSIRLAREYALILRNTRIISNTTRIYLSNRSRYSTSVASVINGYNHGKEEKDRINVKTAQSSVDYDRKKLEKFFSNQVLANFILYGKDVDEFKQCLTAAKAKYEKKNGWAKQLIINIPEIFEIESGLSAEEFEILCNALAPYSHKNSKRVVDLISKNPGWVGYINRLMFSDNLNEQERRHLETLINVVGIEK